MSAPDASALKARRLLWGLAALLLGLTFAGTVVNSGSTPARIESDIDLTSALTTGVSDTFQEVTPGRVFRFPEDHGSHPGFKTEWWYMTGHLREVEGSREFGYQYTHFTSALGPRVEASHSAWTTDRIHMGHLGLTDLNTERFYSWDRLSREALGLSGTQELRFWVEDWALERDSATEFGSWTLKAVEHHQDLGEVKLDLVLHEIKPSTLQGEGGYSRKGPLPKHASYYVSVTRLATTGSVTIEGENIEVTGQSWHDHEWSSELLAEGMVGWDWFSLQLNDDSELMFFQLRRDDGSIEPASSGSLIDTDGAKTDFALSDFSIEVLATHLSPSGRRYPSRWKIEVPALNLFLTVEPRLLDQEMNTGVIYWEGAVSIEGEKQGHSVDGLGFVEMTGY